MKPLRIKFQVMNEVQFNRAFEVAIVGVSNFDQPFTMIADDFFQSMGNTFQAEGAFEGRPRWLDLSPAYAKWKARHYPGRKILELSGRLGRSLSVKGGEDNILSMTPLELTMGTRVPYAKYHQTGTPRMPMRKIIELTQEQKLRWVHIIHQYLFGVYDTAARMTRGM